MMTKDEIFQTVVGILEDTFEIDPASVRAESRLADDLEIDSIDAVDLIVQLKPLAGRRIDPEAFKSVRTVGDVVDALENLLARSTVA